MPPPWFSLAREEVDPAESRSGVIPAPGLRAVLQTTASGRRIDAAASVQVPREEVGNPISVVTQKPSRRRFPTPDCGTRSGAGQGLRLPGR